ncbi:MAG: GNAT family N-acetyltransferase [Lutibacter sp.]|nr:GNAT family N-acetyltransferase [Lutibacter sp.]
MSFEIREGEKKDMPEVLKLIQELARFENEPDAVEVTVEDLEKDGFGEIPLFKIFVAELEEKIVGMALFYSRYSTWKGPTIHLEDLIVSESKRNLKIGKSLYSEVIKYGYQQGVKRIEWVVLDWNKPAIDFYKKSGALVLQDWNIVQMDEQAIKKYLTNLVG